MLLPSRRAGDRFPRLRRRGALRLLVLTTATLLAAACSANGVASNAVGADSATPAPSGAGTDPPSTPRAGDLRFLALADTGSGNAHQQAVADRMAEVHRRRPVDLVVMGGDNIYPRGDLALVEATFSRPYRALLQAGVPFHAVLGNHDIRTANGDPQVGYGPFGMKGRWYTLRKGPVQFFMLDTNGNADWKRQLPWLKTALASSTAPWKVVVGHHPIVSAGHYGDDPQAAAQLGPLFRRHGVQLYINGHEHNYERTRPIDGTTYLIVGGGGAWLRPVSPNARSARAVSAYSFAEVSVSGERMRIDAWDRDGRRIDSAVLSRTSAAAPERGDARPPAPAAP